MTQLVWPYAFQSHPPMKKQPNYAPPRTRVAENSNDGMSDSAVPRLSLMPNNTMPNNTGRSQHIPLPISHVHRTESELQLCEDMAVAEHRDVNMFYRVVNGIRDKQMTLYQSQENTKESDRTIASLIHTRHQPTSRSTRALETIPSVQEHKVYTQPYTAIIAPLMRAPFGQENVLVSEADDWSVSGYEEQLDSRYPVQQQQQYQQYQYQGSSPSLQYANTDEEDEMFTLDM
jgi:hypothetical protein